MRDSGTVLDMLVQKVRRPRLTPSQIIESHLMFDSLTFTLEKIYGGNLLRRNFSLQDAQNCGIQKVLAVSEQVDDASLGFLHPLDYLSGSKLLLLTLRLVTLWTKSNGFLHAAGVSGKQCMS
jgi:hypothetical protein